jgi:hypothetical protein
MSTLFSLGAPITLWMQAIYGNQQKRFNDVPVVKEWLPTESTWKYSPPPPPPPSPISMGVVVVWSSEDTEGHD